MWLTVTENGKKVASGYTTLTFTANVGAKYTVTMSNYQNFVFQYWDNGNTDPSRTFTVTQPATLVAYYSTGGAF